MITKKHVFGKTLGLGVNTRSESQETTVLIIYASKLLRMKGEHSTGCRQEQAARAGYGCSLPRTSCARGKRLSGLRRDARAPAQHRVCKSPHSIGGPACRRTGSSWLLGPRLPTHAPRSQQRCPRARPVANCHPKSNVALRAGAGRVFRSTALPPCKVCRRHLVCFVNWASRTCQGLGSFEAKANLRAAE